MTPTETLTTWVHTMRHEAQDIISIELRPAAGATLPPFTPGAHIDLHLPGGLVRSYSLCNEAGSTDRYVVGVLRDKASRGGSRAVHEQLRIAMPLTISAPRNHFPLEETAAHSVLIAGGIGITPLFAMALRLHRLGASWELHYGARNRARCAFAKTLHEAPFADRVHLHLDDGSAGALLDVPALLSQAPAGSHVYVCGPAGLIDLVLATGRALRWPEARLHHERFSADPLPADGARAFRIVLAHSGLTLEVPADRSVAVVVQAAGVDLPTSCEQGVCGTCITDVLDGTPDHRDQCLSVADRTRCFTPCCSRALSDTLTLAI